MPRSDITGRADVERLVEVFYARVRPDPMLGHFFADIDWAHHIPRITAFWEMVLLGGGPYRGDPMTAHVHLHRRLPMSQAHFDRWLELFTGALDELFAGPKAGEAKERARSIAAVMAHKVRTDPND